MLRSKVGCEIDTRILQETNVEKQLLNDEARSTGWREFTARGRPQNRKYQYIQFLTTTLTEFVPLAIPELN